MQEPSKFCPRCNTQNYEGAMYCYSCSFQFPDATPARRATKLLSTGAIIFLGIFGCLIFTWISSWIRGDKTTTQTAGETASPAPTSAAVSAERMVLDNALVTVYVECTNREYKQYKFRFIVKKSGSPLLTPILQQAGNPNAYSVVVNGVDTGDGDLAFSPNIAAFDRNGKLITTDFNTRPLNGNEALGRAYYNLIAKYERGD
jgi:hypothetical protein